ncbi:LysR family transcriptional regulator [Ruegeria sp.]|uniref:LysR family transcriptional regulator n=1 Tax=Ruegeria sp. TaxID=1879320 RepID=UPI0023118373|nr:LysR family transcriptional regulator [Ruegeria sp.]MDA7966316.1 LysR family transcriptional regulator [Ruegeria sp.]
MSDRKFQLPPLEWIRAFEAAARCGSFTAAAAETGLTQPAISQRIGNLERHLGSKLFVRKARAISLTVEGEAWLPPVQAALTELRESSEALFSSGRDSLTISASQSIIDLWLTPRLARVQRATGAKLSIQSLVLGGQTASVDDVIQIRYGAGNWPHDYQLPLYREAMAPVAAPDLQAQGEDWRSWPRISCTGPRPGWGDYTSRFGIPADTASRLRYDTFQSALGAAKMGLGVALGSLPLCSREIAAGNLVQLTDHVLDHHETYWLLATRDAISRRQWEALAEALTAPGTP